MGIYRTYFDKNNTILKNSNLNTAKNPISELYCGDSVSRFIFYIDFTKLQSLVNNKEIDLADVNTKHILKITNTSNFDITGQLNVNNDIVVSDGNRSASCDIEVRPLTESWDEGNGYDYERVFLLGDNSFVREASNWTQATSTRDFVRPGAVNTAQIIGTQHMDHGNENISIDITDFVNQILTTGVTVNTYTGVSHNYQGFCLKYSDSDENAVSGITKTMGFFTKYTNTFFEPFIETVYDNVITDDRVNFFQHKNNNLFFYAYINGNLTNLDNLPTCNINGTGQTVYQKCKGVYYVTVPATLTNIMDTYFKYEDVWSDLTYNGINLDNVTLSFVMMEATKYYQFGSNVIEPVKYGVSISGVKFAETLTQGEVRKINFHLRKPYTQNDFGLVDNIYCRLYIKQGNNDVEIFDWQQVNKTYNTHSIFLDTSWLIPQTYYMDIKITVGGETNIYNEQLKFTVKNKIIG